MASHNHYIPNKNLFNKFAIKSKDFINLANFFTDSGRTKAVINFKGKNLKKKAQKRLENLYNSCISTSDIVIKYLFSYFSKMNLLDNSYLIITSDHGEHLCGEKDKYLWEHSTFISLYEGVIRVPLLIYGKNINSNIIKKQVQLSDLFHTILHMTGNIKPGMKNFDINKSILYQVECSKTPEYIYGEYIKSKQYTRDFTLKYRKLIKDNLYPEIFNNLYFVRSNHHKYIKYPNREEFYDIINDPWENFNLAEEKKDDIKRFRLLLSNFIEKKKESLDKWIIEKEKFRIKKIVSKLDGI
jgi:arylsulfatase A-like enzyme